MNVSKFLMSAEFIDADVVIVDRNDEVVFDCPGGFSANDEDCPIPDKTILKANVDFWTLEVESGNSVLKIFLR